MVIVISLAEKLSRSLRLAWHAAHLNAVLAKLELWPEVTPFLSALYLDGAITGGQLPANLSTVLPKLTTFSCIGCNLQVRGSVGIDASTTSPCKPTCLLQGPLPVEWTQPENSLIHLSWLGEWCQGSIAAVAQL